MDSRPFSLLTLIPLKPECVAEYMALNKPVLDRMRREPTFISAVVSQSQDEPGLLMLHEMWIDRDDFFNVQMKRDYRRGYEERLPALLRGERTMRTFDTLRGDFAFMNGDAAFLGSGQP